MSKSGPNVVCFHVSNSACARHSGVRFLNLSTSKSGPTVGPFIHVYFTSKCASHHKGVHFFNISTSNSDQSMVCLSHFDFKMCFTPQRRVLFQHLSFQKCCEHGEIFRILTSKHASRRHGTFGTSELPKALRTRCVFHILTSKCALRHNGVPFLSQSAPEADVLLAF